MCKNNLSVRIYLIYFAKRFCFFLYLVSVPAEAFYQNHGNLYSMMKGKMGPSNLHMFTGTLCKELHEHMAHLGTEGTGDLNDLVR